jgi:hypothetical protein
MALLNPHRSGGGAWRRLAGAIYIAAAVFTPTSHAHIVPIPPSLCSVDPVDVRLPEAGVVTSATATDGASNIRIVYDANASVVRACPATPGTGGDCDDGARYGFVLDASEGVLGLPARFGGLMESSGDVVLGDVPLSVTFAGETVSVPVTLTTGLVSAGGDVFEGEALEGLGSWSLVGLVAGNVLPPAFGGQAIVLRMACQPRPVPDKDQFVPPSVVTAIRGQVGPDVIRLRASVKVGQADRPGLSRPFLLAVRLDGATIATAVISGGLQGRKKLAGTSDDGRTTVTARAFGPSRVALQLEIRTAPPAQALRSRSLVGLTIDTGTLLARGERLFRAAPEGVMLRRR